MKLLAALWSLHTISPLILALMLGDNLSSLAYIAFLLFGIGYLIQLGREAVKRNRSWIVWCPLGVVIPLWPILSFPVFYFVTRNDDQFIESKKRINKLNV